MPCPTRSTQPRANQATDRGPHRLGAALERQRRLQSSRAAERHPVKLRRGACGAGNLCELARLVQDGARLVVLTELDEGDGKAGKVLAPVAPECGRTICDRPGEHVDRDGVQTKIPITHRSLDLEPGGGLVVDPRWDSVRVGGRQFGQAYRLVEGSLGAVAVSGQSMATGQPLRG